MRLLQSSRLLLALCIVTLSVVTGMVGAERAASSMATAANRLLESLTPDQRAQATFAFDTAERTNWHFIPTEMFPRNGLTLKAMTDEQRARAHDLLSAGLSQQGYLTATAIMDLESVLHLLETDGRLVRDPETYLFSVFGTPSSDGAWGWRVEGHHMSMHFTVVDGTAVAASPYFFGSNPAHVRSGPKSGLRVLREREDAARALVTALDASQRAVAILEDVAPDDILTAANVDIDPLSPVGVKASALTASQREMLMQVIGAYTSIMASDIAGERTESIRAAGLDNVTFAWAGPIERGAQHYYRVQGPTFLIEYDNVQGNGNHVHSVWRDFNGDFGRDLLREHLHASAH
ncbi:MAG: DUF3500 domain-containing protein [Acidobacteria bacterium]|nr:DUF3500 domain-containing protein [Acidobacteriota bacterium]